MHCYGTCRLPGAPSRSPLPPAPCGCPAPRCLLTLMARTYLVLEGTPGDEAPHSVILDHRDDISRLLGVILGKHATNSSGGSSCFRCLRPSDARRSQHVISSAVTCDSTVIMLCTQFVDRCALLPFYNLPSWSLVVRKCLHARMSLYEHCIRITISSQQTIRVPTQPARRLRLRPPEPGP